MGANTVYEPEIDTHLAVAHIAYTTLYDSATGSGNALSIMQGTYGQPTWHHPNTDLHYALLSGRNFGGQAYIGELCSPSYGFGVTGNLNGNYVSMDQRVMWDMMISCMRLAILSILYILIKLKEEEVCTKVTILRLIHGECTK